MNFRHLLVHLMVCLGLLSLSLTGCAGTSDNPVNRLMSWDFGLLNRPTPLSPEEQKADALYQQVWQAIDKEYLDPRHNGQDWSQWAHRYDGKLLDMDDARVAIDTMLASLNDDYTRYLPPRDMREQTMSIDSKLYGIGLQIFVRNNQLTVVAPLEDTPAEKAGLLPLDEIVTIDGQSTAGLPVEEAADRIRGKAGTQVALGILRGKKRFTVQVTRAEIRLKSVFSQPLPDKNIGYIRLNSFISETMLSELETIMKKMADKKALILDLRGNFGGLLSNAVDLSDLFLDEGAIVSVIGRSKDQEQVFTAHEGQITKKPLVVLIDGGSASASEIFSGALKDNHRATLIGLTTFGKGLVQKIYPLDYGAGLNLTISRYLTPSGLDIHHRGIDPNIRVGFSEKDVVSGKDPQLQEAIRFLESRKPLLAEQSP